MNTATRCLIVLVFCLWALPTRCARAEDIETKSNLEVWASCRSLPEEFLDGIGLRADEEFKNGVYVLDELEAFFLIGPGNFVIDHKEHGANRDRRCSLHFGTSIRIAYQTERPSECFVLVCPLAENEDSSVKFSIDAPEDSTFALNGKVELTLPLNSVAILPSDRLVDNGKRRLYLWLRTSKGEAAVGQPPLSPTTR